MPLSFKKSDLDLMVQRDEDFMHPLVTHPWLLILSGTYLLAG